MSRERLVFEHNIAAYAMFAAHEFPVQESLSEQKKIIVGLRTGNGQQRTAGAFVKK